MTHFSGLIDGYGSDTTRTGIRFSTKPGTYLSGRFGVRIEEFVAVTDTGGRRPKDDDRHLRIVS